MAGEDEHLNITLPERLAAKDFMDGHSFNPRRTSPVQVKYDLL